MLLYFSNIKKATIILSKSTMLFYHFFSKFKNRVSFWNLKTLICLQLAKNWEFVKRCAKEVARSDGPEVVR
jgi:hypothetical protein